MDTCHKVGWMSHQVTLLTGYSYHVIILNSCFLVVIIVVLKLCGYVGISFLCHQHTGKKGSAVLGSCISVPNQWAVSCAFHPFFTSNVGVINLEFSWKFSHGGTHSLQKRLLRTSEGTFAMQRNLFSGFTVSSLTRFLLEMGWEPCLVIIMPIGLKSGSLKWLAKAPVDLSNVYFFTASIAV